MGKIIQKARLENSADLAAMREGQLPRQDVRAVEVDLLVDTGAAMLDETRKGGLHLILAHQRLGHLERDAQGGRVDQRNGRPSRGVRAGAWLPG